MYTILLLTMSCFVRDVCKFEALIIRRYFKGQIPNYKTTKDFSELKNGRSSLEVRPMHVKISISRGRHT